MTVALANPDSRSAVRLLPRYELLDEGLLEVDIRVGDTRHSGEIVDLSRGGAKITVGVNLPIDTDISVTIKSGSQEIVKRSRICWNRATLNGWWIGIAFEAELGEKQFNSLATGGFIERRRDARIPYEATMTARWELGSEPVPVKLVDLSSGGFKMTAPSAAEVGKRVLIETAGNAGSPIVAKVQWQHPTEAEFEIGCAFVDKNGCGTLMQQLGIGHAPPEEEQSSPRYSTRRLVALTLGVSTVAFLAWLGNDGNLERAVTDYFSTSF